jgi:hypothetical protein
MAPVGEDAFENVGRGLRWFFAPIGRIPSFEGWHRGLVSGSVAGQPALPLWILEELYDTHASFLARLLENVHKVKRHMFPYAERGGQITAPRYFHDFGSGNLRAFVSLTENIMSRYLNIRLGCP